MQQFLHALKSFRFSAAKQDIRLNSGNADVSSAMRATRVTSKHKFEETLHSELISTGNSSFKTSLLSDPKQNVNKLSVFQFQFE